MYRYKIDRYEKYITYMYMIAIYYNNVINTSTAHIKHRQTNAADKLKYPLFREKRLPSFI